MIFSSYVFIFVFLPATILFYAAIAATLPRRFAISWLVVCSFFYYAWWNPPFLFLLITSILINFGLGVQIGKVQGKSLARVLMVLGIPV